MTLFKIKRIDNNVTDQFWGDVPKIVGWASKFMMEIFTGPRPGHKFFK